MGGASASGVHETIPPRSFLWLVNFFAPSVFPWLFPLNCQKNCRGLDNMEPRVSSTGGVRSCGPSRRLHCQEGAPPGSPVKVGVGHLAGEGLPVTHRFAKAPRPLWGLTKPRAAGLWSLLKRPPPLGFHVETTEVPLQFVLWGSAISTPPGQAPSPTPLTQDACNQNVPPGPQVFGVSRILICRRSLSRWRGAIWRQH